MYVSMSQLSLMLLYSIFLGIFLGVSYEIIRLFRITAGIKYKSSEDKRYDYSSLAIVGKYFKNRKQKNKKASKGRVYIAIGDILFWLFSAICVSIFIYYYNDGIFRSFVIFGCIVGFLLYYFTVGKVILFISQEIVFYVKIILIYIGFFIFYPIFYLFRKIFCVFRIIIRKIILIIKKLYAIICLYIYSLEVEKTILASSKYGFLQNY